MSWAGLAHHAPPETQSSVQSQSYSNKTPQVNPGSMRPQRLETTQKKQTAAVETAAPPGHPTTTP